MGLSVPLLPFAVILLLPPDPVPGLLGRVHRGVDRRAPREVRVQLLDQPRVPLVDRLRDEVGVGQGERPPQGTFRKRIFFSLPGHSFLFFWEEVSSRPPSPRRRLRSGHAGVDGQQRAVAHRVRLDGLRVLLLVQVLPPLAAKAPEEHPVLVVLPPLPLSLHVPPSLPLPILLLPDQPNAPREPPTAGSPEAERPPQAAERPLEEGEAAAPGLEEAPLRLAPETRAL